MNKLVRLKCQNMYKTCSHMSAGSFTNLGTGVRINWGSESPPVESQRDLFGSCTCNLRINWMDFSPYCSLSILQTNYTDLYNKRNVYRAFVHLCVYYKSSDSLRSLAGDSIRWISIVFPKRIDAYFLSPSFVKPIPALPATKTDYNANHYCYWASHVLKFIITV